MKVLMVGGGSGGHVFPLIAIQQQLHTLDRSIESVIVSDVLADDVKNEFNHGTRFKMIKSGKIRRFAHWKWYDYFKPNRYKFYLFNLIDVFKLIIGGIQSLKILLTEKPDVVFVCHVNCDKTFF